MIDGIVRDFGATISGFLGVSTSMSYGCIDEGHVEVPQGFVTWARAKHECDYPTEDSRD